MTPGQVYREGANKGVIVGVYLSVIFLCAVLSDYVPLLSLVAILLMLGVPTLAMLLSFVCAIAALALKVVVLVSLWNSAEVFRKIQKTDGNV